MMHVLAIQHHICSEKPHWKLHKQLKATFLSICSIASTASGVKEFLCMFCGKHPFLCRNNYLYTLSWELTPPIQWRPVYHQSTTKFNSVKRRQIKSFSVLLRSFSFWYHRGWITGITEHILQKMTYHWEGCWYVVAIQLKSDVSYMKSQRLETLSS